MFSSLGISMLRNFPLCSYGLRWIVHQSTIDLWRSLLWSQVLAFYLGRFQNGRTLPKSARVKTRGRMSKLQLVMKKIWLISTKSNVHLKAMMPQKILWTYSLLHLKEVPKDTWIAITQLMNPLWAIDVKQWLERILEFMDWLDWILAKTKSHHIFPLGDCTLRWTKSGRFWSS
jgi:hypothetical protein